MSEAGDARRFRVLFLALVLASIAFAVFIQVKHVEKMKRRATTPTTVTLRFHPMVAGERLVFNEPRYRAPGSAGPFSIRDFQFFVSNIRFRSAAGDYVEPDSYHLVRFDGDGDGDGDKLFEIVLNHVPPRKYSAIEIGVGIDAAANGTIAQRGDLDPNGRMAWTWEVGYKFVLLEGQLENEPRVPLVYHVGFSENYRVVTAAVGHVAFDDGPVMLDSYVEIMNLFRGEGDDAIDMRALPTVKFDRADAARLANHAARMLQPAWTGDVTIGVAPPAPEAAGSSMRPAPGSAGAD